MQDSERARELQAQVRHRVHEFEQETGIVVSERAQALITILFESLVFDPHPAWNVSQQQLEERADAFIDSLPSYLRSIESRIAPRHTITSFDAFFWLRVNIGEICDLGCPF
jgi:hypothetical protein